jgi:glutamyl/glutaminyl-tRNA synthetase
VRPFFDVPWLEEGIDVVKTSVHRLTEFENALRFVLHFEDTSVAWALQSFPTARAVVSAAAEYLRAHSVPTDAGSYKAMADAVKAASGAKGKDLFMPLRVALTGVDHGPELVRVIPLLERACKVDSRVLPPGDRVERAERILRG